MSRSKRKLCALGWLWMLVLSWPAYAAEEFIVRDIRVEGLQRISAGTVFNYLPVSISDRVDSRKTAEIIRALYATGFFRDVRLERDGDVLVVAVIERPVIASIEISGNKEIDTENLTKALKDIGLAEGRVVNRSVLDRIEQELQRQYFNRGKYGVELKTTVSPLERNRVAVSIDIKEGKPARIKQINIIGNEIFPDDELVDEFDLSTTNWLSFYTRDDQYSRQKLAGDLETLRSFYLDRGYIKFRIESTQVSITPDKRDIYITIVIDEGPVYTVSDLKLAGDLVLPNDELFPLIDVRRGEPFSRKNTTSSTEKISKLLSNHGYAFANVNSIPEVDDEKREVALTFFVDPGKRAYVRRINVVGNTRTRDEVLRREMRQMEAAWFSTEAVNKSRDRLKRLGFFDDVSIETPAVVGSTDEVDVNVTVKEKASGNFLAGIGFSQVDGFILNTSITENNFLGTGKRVVLALQDSTAITNYQLAYTNPYYTIDGISRGFELRYRKTNFDDLDIANYATDVTRGGVNFGFPISDLSRAGISLGVEDIQLGLGNDAGEELVDWIDTYGDSYFDWGMKANWVYDSRDSAFFARKGVLADVDLEVSLPGSDLLYYKLGASAHNYLPLTKRTSLLVRGEVGYGGGFGDTDELPFFYNYFAGGLRSVRGYRTYSLGPRDSKDNPVGGNLLTVANVDLLLPVPIEGLEETMRFSTFFDIGNVFNVNGKVFESTGFEVGELRYSVGVAGTWLSPLGLLTASLGYPLNSKSGDDTEIFQFTIGTGF